MDHHPSSSDAAVTEHAAVRHAVVQLVAERGLAAVTVDDVAIAAGVDAEALVRATEGDLAPLALDAYDAILATLLERCVSAYGVGPWQEGVRRGIAAVFDVVLEDPVASRFAFIALPAGGRAILAARAAKRAGWAEAFLQRCAAEPAQRPSAMQIELFFGAVRHTVEDHLRRDALRDLPAALEPLVATFEPPPPAPAQTPAVPA